MTAILTALEGLVRARARLVDRYNAEDLEQVGREALWLALRRFAGNTRAQFLTFADRTMTGAMRDASYAARYPGISKDEAKLWLSALKRCDGDEDQAERLACSGELAWRMSTATAKAVRSAVRPPEDFPEHLGTPRPREALEGRYEARYDPAGESGGTAARRA
ncbi:sigma factor [Streptomyces sp. Z26]|uniref:sigma factor n=1 Tax=Streptomyces sp. Z26 TaxID=2500177 RepID=UPI001404E725|nr:sigma factor [Streptomyces sp. Z26]